jgi:hypothetical protein
MDMEVNEDCVTCEGSGELSIPGAPYPVECEKCFGSGLRPDWLGDYRKGRENRKAVETHVVDSIKSRNVELSALLDRVNGEWTYEDSVYRYYHHSFKVYYVQDLTQEVVRVLRSLAPEGTALSKMFLKIVKDGTGKKFELSHNDAWSYHTRSMLEAFFHAKYFLEMAVKYGKLLDEAPTMLPCGWAAFLYLYGIR